MSEKLDNIHLNVRRMRFCHEYVRNGGKINEASKAAGYATANEGSRLLEDPTVQAYVQRLVDREQAELGYDRRRYISDVMATGGLLLDGTHITIKMFFRDKPIYRLVVGSTQEYERDANGDKIIDGYGDPEMIPPAEWTDEMASAVQEYRIHETVAGTNFSVKLHPRMEVLKEMAAILKLHEQAGGTPEELAKKLVQAVQEIYQVEEVGVGQSN